MTFAGFVFFGIGLILMGFYREIERGADWIEEMVGPRRLLSLQVQSDRVLYVATSFVMFGGLVMLIGGTMKAAVHG